MELHLNPNVCPSSLMEDEVTGLLRPITEGETAHKWSEEVTRDQQGKAQYECTECGATKPTPFKCPLCESDEVRHVEYNGTHLYVCNACPFVALEFVHPSDADHILDYLKRK